MCVYVVCRYTPGLEDSKAIGGTPTSDNVAPTDWKDFYNVFLPRVPPTGSVEPKSRKLPAIACPVSNAQQEAAWPFPYFAVPRAVRTLETA